MELQVLLGRLNYLRKFSSVTAEVLRLYTLVKLNDSYQKLFDKTKTIMKEDTCVKFHDETKGLYLELGTRLQQLEIK